MLSVGELAALVNVIVLVVIAFVDRAVEVIVRNFAAARLRTSRSAPVVHDSDTWILNIPRSLVKYRRHPAIFVTVLLSVFVISSEVITEIGVGVSHKCGPVVINGTVIKPGDLSGRVVDVELAASAFFVQNITFIDTVNNALERVPAGLPKRLTGSECLKCMDKNLTNFPDIMRNCSVTSAGVYEPDELEIGIRNRENTSAFGNITIGFRERHRGKKSYNGSGDITKSGSYYAGFVVDSTTSETITWYLEYTNNSHIRELINKTSEPQKDEIWEPTRSSVELLKVTCEVNKLSQRNFQRALQVYRTVMLENTVNPMEYDSKEAREKGKLNAQDVYRAGLSMKVIEDEPNHTLYYSYVSCGAYNMKYLCPMTVLLLVLILLYILSFRCSERNMRSIPFSSRTWFEHSQQAGFSEDLAIEQEPRRRGFLEEYTAGMSDEMIILEFGDEANLIRPSIALKCKSRSRLGDRVTFRFLDFRNRRRNKGDIDNRGDIEKGNESGTESTTTDSVGK